MIVQERKMRKRIAMVPVPALFILLTPIKCSVILFVRMNFLCPLPVCMFHAFAKGSSKKRRRRRIKLQQRQLAGTSAVEHTLTMFDLFLLILIYHI